MFIEAFCTLISTKVVPLFMALVGFGVLITIHELGHFLFAKLFGIDTPTFSIGFGPTLISRNIGGTNFQLAAIPLGGFVEITGIAEAGQGDQKHAEDKSDRSFVTKPYWQKLLVLLAGIGANMLFAYVTFTGLYLVGIPIEKGQVIIKSVISESPADKAGIKKGDAIASVGGALLSTKPAELQGQFRETLLTNIAGNPDKTVKFSIIRDGKQRTESVRMGSRDNGEGQVGWMGAVFALDLQPVEGEYERYSLIPAVKKGVARTHSIVAQIYNSIRAMVSNRTLEGAGGPVMILTYSFKFAQRSLMQLLAFLALISINLAMINVLPIGILDGARLFQVTVEALTGRSVPIAIRAVIDVGFTVLFLMFFVYLTYRDVLALIFS